MVSRAGVAGVVAIFALGVWLVAAPFALRYQPVGAGWAGTTRMDVIIGGTLAAVGFVGTFRVLAGRVRELYADARSAASLAAAAKKENTGP